MRVIVAGLRSDQLEKSMTNFLVQWVRAVTSQPYVDMPQFWRVETLPQARGCSCPEARIVYNSEDE